MADANQNDNKQQTDSKPDASVPSGTSNDDITPSTPLSQVEPDQAKQNQKAAENRAKEIDDLKDFDDDEKKILKLYDQGVQVFKIAKDVFKFANSDTVGRVMLTVRRAHADDYNQVEDVNSTKGYSGIGV